MDTNPYEVINTKKDDKMAAMEWIEREMKRLGRDLRAMEWDSTDEDGNHLFRVVAPSPEQGAMKMVLGKATPLPSMNVTAKASPAASS